jgi:endonuclease III related protein
MNINIKLIKIYNKLYEYFGNQHWWPGDTAFEISIGAILTQNTSWKNVEKAINNLKQKKLLCVKKMFNMKIDELADLIRPAGYYNIKAKYIKNFIFHIILEYNGNLDKMFNKDTLELRKELLGLTGIGQETADSILLYAANKPIFVVDAYTKRIFEAQGLIEKKDLYKKVQDLFMNNLEHDVNMFNEYHALIVALCKDICRKSKPKCGECPLNCYCKYSE